ncbi:MAG: hypothetical protein QOK05_2104 [Chloroflexota bacterium]|jgi:hypothetical protein|nr:hypothetical protein [Chloroflexota bacterium]
MVARETSMIAAMASYSADDLALAALLKIVPTGFRLIDTADTRFTGVRGHFTRLALRHVGARPSLVGFCAPEQDPVAAATAAAGWAAQNLVPTAIQRRVVPGVLVIALHPPAGVQPGWVRGLSVRTAVWAVQGGRLRAAGRPPGSPSPRLVRAAVSALERGVPPPSIGQIDVAERSLMYGRGSRRSFTLGGGAGIGALVAVFLLLRFVPALLSPRGPGPAQRQASRCAAPSCVNLGQGDNGRTLTIPAGTDIMVTLTQPTSQSCIADSDPAVLQLEQCTTTGSESPTTVGLFRAAASGTATLTGDQFTVTVVVR